jgi:uncharacterized metal-binding protein
MNGKQHKKTNLLLATILSFLYLYFTKNVALIPLLKFWTGALPCAILLTPDLDTWSEATKVWGPFKFIWKPFRKAGHREILHNPVWGPFILICFVAVPLHYMGFDLWPETITGMVCMIESHIIVDHVV